MKKLYSSLLLCLSIFTANAQSVAFDDYVSSTDNDLTNLFTGGYDFYQIATDGITGGAIKIDNSNILMLHYLEDAGYAFYNDLFSNDFDSFATSICFKHSTGPRPYVFASLLMVRSINKIQGSNETSTACLGFERDDTEGYLSFYNEPSTTTFGLTSMSDGHWYRMGMHIKKGATIFEEEGLVGYAYIEDIGSDGLAMPDTIAMGPVDCYTANLFYEPDGQFKIGFAGNKADGFGLLDNFSITVWYPETEEPTSINPVGLQSSVIIPTIFNNNLPIKIESEDLFYYKVFDLNGKLIDAGEILRSKVLATDHYASGMYIVSLVNGKTKLTRRIVKP